MAEQNGRASGSLIVRTVTAQGALPIEGAAVTVRSSGEGGTPFLRTVYTDESGRTPILTLDTPPVASSLSPGGVRPYATYDIRIEKDGFYLHENRAVPVFSGVVSIQSAELIPLSPYGNGVPPVGSTNFSSEQSLDEGV